MEQLLWGTHERAYETLAGCSSLLHDIPSPDEWLSGETKPDAGVGAEGILFQAHDRLGQIPPQVMGAYNSTQHSTTGVSPHMMLTGHEKSLSLTFSYPEYEGKKASPQVYIGDVFRRQQELNDLCRLNTQQALKAEEKVR